MKSDKLLDSIISPDQLRGLSDSELSSLADELRDRIIGSVSEHGGHLASNLGVAELAIALHYVFDFTNDRLLWDVGHQCYAHKMLTGRCAQFDTLRHQCIEDGSADLVVVPADVTPTEIVGHDQHDVGCATLG